MTEREQLELKVNYALSDLSKYFTKKNDPLQYEVNRLWRELEKLREIPEVPKVIK
jgi:hypothetical protein